MCSTGFAHCATTLALAIPEVVELICGSGCLSRSDLASLCQVSRYMLDIGTPLLWRNTTAEGLLELIDSADLYWQANGVLCSITLDAYDVHNETFSRFHSYAPHVQTLEIYGQTLKIHGRKSRRCYTVEGWGLLRTEMETQGRPLLPNLKTLRFLNTSHSHGLDEIKWITTFATHGVKEVSLTPNRSSPSGQIPFSIGSTILETLANLCPSVRMLDLSTNDDFYPAFTGDAEFNTALAHLPTRPWYQELKHLTRLRHLTVSEGWLYPASLQELGDLPELESLSIVPGPLDEFDYMFDTNPVLPNGAFRQLTELSMLGLDGFGMGVVLHVTEMSRKVTAMKLELCFDDVREDDEYGELERLFEGLGNALCLRELYISLPFRSEDGGRPADASDSMERMGPHPSLEHIHISGIRINKESRRLCHSIRNLASIWPNVRTLSMPSQHASIRDLEAFATLPSLRHLTVNLNLKRPVLPEKPDFERAPLETLTSSGPVRLSARYKDLLLSANALSLFWPSLQRVTWSDEDPARTQMADFFNSAALRFSREFLFESLQGDAKLSAIKCAREMKARFKLVIEGVEEADSDSDTDTEEEYGSE